MHCKILSILGCVKKHENAKGHLKKSGHFTYKLRYVVWTNGYKFYDNRKNKQDASKQCHWQNELLTGSDG